MVSYGIANCVPCVEFEPILERAAVAYVGRVRFGKGLMQIPGRCREIKKRFVFETFPTTHFYRRGALVLTVDRKVEYEELAAAIDRHLLS